MTQRFPSFWQLDLLLSHLTSTSTTLSLQSSTHTSLLWNSTLLLYSLIPCFFSETQLLSIVSSAPYHISHSISFPISTIKVVYSRFSYKHYFDLCYQELPRSVPRPCPRLRLTRQTFLLISIIVWESTTHGLGVMMSLFFLLLPGSGTLFADVSQPQYNPLIQEIYFTPYSR